MKIFILCIVSLISMSVFGKTWTITNSGNSFVPQALAVQMGDTIIFDIDNSHNAVEVSKTTWDANGNAKLSGGFDVAFGGGTLFTNTLSEGSHYYVCTPHVAMGMKGTLVISSIVTAVNTQKSVTSIFPNPAEDYLKIRTSNKNGSAYRIIDPTGRVVKIGNLASDEEFINIKNLSSGMYFLQISGKEPITLKFKKK